MAITAKALDALRHMTVQIQEERKGIRKFPILFPGIPDQQHRQVLAESGRSESFDTFAIFSSLQIFL
ncbi:hypothetical protein [Faecalibaculum rodentium]|uniref:hypothetical protein n=1 Tax=Faecalibaculum rodentium TaxID=1702221 RepID=UPI003F66FF3F